MRQGVTEPRSTPLQYRGQNDAELATKLALMEADALDHMRPRLVEEPLEGAELKTEIVDRLRRM